MMKFLAIGLALLAFTWVVSGGSKTAPGQAKQLLERGAKIIDVRTPAEFKSGHLDGAVNVPVNELDQQISQVTTNKTEPLLIHCQSGGRSATAAQKLHKLGYTNVVDLGSLRNARKVTGK